MEAVYFGTFAPLHRGHVSNIIYAKRKYDFVHIIVSGYTGDRGDQAKMNLNDRFRVVREIFNQDELVQVDKLSEDEITKYPNGWEEWLSQILKIIGSPQNKVFICAELEYQEELEKRGYRVECLDRSIIPISGTKIRNKPYENWEYIHSSFRKFFTKKVLIYGSASTGKTTLTKDLANYFNTTFTLEYAREYEKTYNVLDEELDIRDLTNMGIGQFNKNKQMISNPATNKIFFADTDVMTTLTYLEEYSSYEKEFNSVKNIFEGLIKKQEWDLILFLQPDTDYIDDGFRDMRHKNPEERNRLNNHFKEKLEENKLDYISLSGNFEKKFYEALKHCEKLLNSKG